MKKLLLTMGFIVCMAQLYAQQQALTDSLKKHLTFLASDSMMGRSPGSPQMKKAAQYIASAFKNAGIEAINGNYYQPFTFYRNMTLYGTNVIGVIESNNPEYKNEYIVLGAHYDHIGAKINNDTMIYNGADDNASGVAGIIEAGRMLAANRHLLKRSVLIIAFDAEEQGLLGSYYFVNHPTVKLNNIKCMYSVDMIGALDRGKILKFNGCGSIKNGTEFMNQTVKIDSLPVEFKKSSFMWKDRTDTKPFYEKQIASMYVSTGLKSAYHKPEDDVKDIDFEGMTKAVQQLYNAALQVNTKDQIAFTPTREPIREQKARYRIGITVGYDANAHLYHGEALTGQEASGFSAGVMSQIKIARMLAIQSAVKLAREGAQTPLGNLKLNTLNVPVSLLLITPPNASRVFVSIGGYYRYAFSGTLGSSSIDWATTQLNRTDYGLSYGGGIELFNTQLGFTAHYGLADVGLNNDIRITNTSYCVHLAYFF